MEAASSFFESRSRGWNVNSLMNFSHLNSRVQLHLRKVYTTLCLSLLVASLGVYAHMLVNLGGFLTSMAFIGCVMWLMSVPSYEEGLVLTAFLGTIAIFASFSGAALFAKRREYLFLGGILSSAVSAMLTLRFCSYFFGGASAMFNLELYGGLLVFVGYVLFDTQLIIERADKGDDDYIQHTLDLFMDFVSIFVRILVILTKNAGEKSRKEESRRKRSQ